MGKDIDRNITRQLWERFKNTFSRNDIIPVKNGGTGVNNLDSLYPKLVSDRYVKTVTIKDMQLEPGFTLQSDSTAKFIINKKSMYIDGWLHVLRSTGITSDKFISFTIPNISGYNINKITIGSNNTRISINNNICSLYCYFNQENDYNNYFDLFIPFI